MNHETTLELVRALRDLADSSEELVEDRNGSAVSLLTCIDYARELAEAVEGKRNKATGLGEFSKTCPTCGAPHFMQEP